MGRVYSKVAGGEWETTMGRERLGGGKGDGEKKGQEKGGNSQMDMMECLGGHRL